VLNTKGIHSLVKKDCRLHQWLKYRLPAIKFQNKDQCSFADYEVPA